MSTPNQDFKCSCGLESEQCDRAPKDCGEFQHYKNQVIDRQKTMNHFKVKVVKNNAILTSTANEFTRKSFTDLNEMVAYVNSRNLIIVNPEALPPAFQAQLTTN